MNLRHLIFVNFLISSSTYAFTPGQNFAPKILNNALSNKLKECNFSTSYEISQSLYLLKQEKVIKKWDITLLEPKIISKKDLYITTRTSFATEDYMGDIIKAANKRNVFDFSKLPFIILPFVAISSVIIPQLPISTLFKNIFGLLNLSLPFLLSSLAILPTDLQGKLKSLLSSTSTSSIDERIIYHEAGHFLAGYLCGLPIISYDTSGETDAGTTIDFSVLNPTTMSITSPNTYQSSSASPAPFMGRTGHILVVAMAGVVAETLRFGDSCGGVEDFPIALETLRLSAIPVRDRDDTLRWGVLKALNLLRIHRDELDAIAVAMKDGLSVSECIACIESVGSDGDLIARGE